MHLSRQELYRLMDGELPAGAARTAREHLRGCGACEGAFQTADAIRGLAREALGAPAGEVSFEGMQAAIATAIVVERPLGWSDRLSTWVSEVFRHRRPVWVPVGAIAAAAIGVIALLPTGAPVVDGSSRVLSVATRGGPAIVFDVESEDGTASTGIVWINDSTSAGEGG